ncbi:34-kDa subunit of RNA polymerase III (C) [Zalaria obscura]|uniref:34-kDa subunit of RNA polymerase III (C) n=1 Tax=Zalaria obscura TaxID=2024903 RepID=A0ACC3S7X9_9PEZI
MTVVEDQGATLYEKCLATALSSPEGKAKLFYQEELIAFGIVDNVADLMGLCQGLMHAQLLRLMQLDNKTCFALRTKEIANKVVTLAEEERMVYNQIENTGTNGIWQKNIKQRTGLHQTAITRAMKTLETKRLVKQIKSVKNPAQKIYMLSHLSPNEDVTGGPWFSDGELDIELIGVTADAVVHFIEKQSWARGFVKRERSPSPGMDGIEEAGMKRKRTDDIEGVHTKSRKRHDMVETQISFPPGYRGYPTVSAIHHFIRESGFIKEDVVLTEGDIKGLLDVLVFDDRIEQIGNGYRTVRGVQGATEAMMGMVHGKAPIDMIEDVEGNGLTQAPCGRCPVFNLCEEGGPVNARNCEYFEAWLRA